MSVEGSAEREIILGECVRQRKEVNKKESLLPSESQSSAMSNAVSPMFKLTCTHCLDGHKWSCVSPCVSRVRVLQKPAQALFLPPILLVCTHRRGERGKRSTTCACLWR